ncbi:MAG TPA: hypothetical protein VKB78_10885 [Pirellulales bacterium]|nr:hypothetical protein [Pirellulales bacterium]
MPRACLCSLATLAFLWAIAVRADDPKSTTDQQGKTHLHGTVAKVDSQNDQITIQTTNKEGKQSEKTLSLDKNAEIHTSGGKTAKLSDLKPGEEVRITEHDGKVTKISCESAATITNVNAQAGTVTVKMTDENGKETTKTFHLTQDMEYVDSTGRVATLDVFRAGDRVLLVEEEGQLRGMRQPSSQSPTIGSRPGEIKK